jgi:hypothetical protein
MILIYFISLTLFFAANANVTFPFSNVLPLLKYRKKAYIEMPTKEIIERIQSYFKLKQKKQ